MSTNTTTTTTAAPVVVTVADSKVVASITSYTTALDKAFNGYNNIAKETEKVAARMGLTTQSQVTDLLRLSFFESAKLSDASDAEKAEYLDTVKSDISNLTTLVMPRPITEGKGDSKVVLKSTADLLEARNKAWAYNEALPKNCRRNLFIGQKSVLAIVRGIEDVDYIIGVKNGTIKPRPAADATSQNGAAAANSSATSVGGAASGTPAAGQQGSPEGQHAEVPSPQGDGQKVISNPRDLLRAAIRNLSTVFSTTHGLTPDVIKEIIQDEVAKLA